MYWVDHRKIIYWVVNSCNTAQWVSVANLVVGNPSHKCNSPLTLDDALAMLNMGASRDLSKSRFHMHLEVGDFFIDFTEMVNVLNI